MDINAVFDQIFTDFPRAREGNTLSTKRPNSVLSWRKVAKGTYHARGPKGGTHVIAYNERSNKITIVRGKP